jgi:hypothetical protein
VECSDRVPRPRALVGPLRSMARAEQCVVSSMAAMRHNRPATLFLTQDSNFFMGESHPGRHHGLRAMPMFTKPWTIEVPYTKGDAEENQVCESAFHEGTTR